MLPDNLGAVLLLLALIPGWIYIVQKEQYLPTPSRNGLGEILQVAAAGLAFTGLAICTWALSSGWLQTLGFGDFNEWGKTGSDYVSLYPTKSIVSIALLIAFAVALATLTSRFQRWNLPRKYNASSTWEQTLGTGPKNSVTWVGLETIDGQLIEGILHSFELDSPSDGSRDIALKSPIYVTDDAPRVESPVQRVIVPSEQIRYLTVQFEEIPSPPLRWPWIKRLLRR